MDTKKRFVMMFAKAGDQVFGMILENFQLFTVFRNSSKCAGFLTIYDIFLDRGENGRNMQNI